MSVYSSDVVLREHGLMNCHFKEAETFAEERLTVHMLLVQHTVINKRKSNQVNGIPQQMNALCPGLNITSAVSLSAMFYLPVTPADRF